MDRPPLAGLLPPEMKELRWRPLMTFFLDIKKPYVVGKTPVADRRIAELPGGYFEGERLQGKVLPSGSDWQTLREDSAWMINVRTLLETDDGALIGMTYTGLRHGPKEIIDAIGRGDVEDAARWPWDVFKVGSWIFLALSLPMLLLTGPVLSLFVRDPALVEIGRLPLQLLGATILIDGLGLIMMHALLGAGASRLVMLVATGLQWGLFLPVAYLIGPVWGLGLTAVWIAMGSYRMLQTLIFTRAWQKRDWAHIKI